MKTRIRVRTGNFNIVSDEELVEIALFLPEGAPQPVIRELWPTLDAPNVGGLLPSQVADIIYERLLEYAYSSKSEDTAKAVQWVRDHAQEIDMAYAKSRIEILEKHIELWGRRFHSVYKFYPVT